jgi:hypothetical protein
MGLFSKSEEDLTGLASFFDFLCAVFSRIAYAEAPMPLFLMSGMFEKLNESGQPIPGTGIIPQSLLKALSKITNVSELNQDEKVLFNLDDAKNTIPTRTYNGKKYVNFIPYAEQINILIEDTKKSNYYSQKTDSNIRIISLADSNYGDVLIIGIKYLPNFVFTSFRGTYSTKTAQSYIQLESKSPVEIAKGIKLLKGIAKIEFEMLHSILAANNDMVTTFLKTNNVIPVFTGHSLGGALATILDLEYCSIVSKKGEQTFSPLSGTPVCISFGSPRVLSKTTSETLCDMIINGIKSSEDNNPKSLNILFHRYSNDGDPVTALPPPGFGFYHPCSSDKNKANGYRKFVSRDCKSSTKASSSNLARSEYTKPIKCRDEEATTLTKVINSGPNMYDHMTYLYISFAKAADILHLFGKSAFTVETTEVGRVKQTNPEFSVKSGETEMRIVQMTGNSSTGEYTEDFIDLVKLRKKGDSILNEDSLVSKKLFSDILYVKQDKINVSFNSQGLPIPFPKKVDDRELEDEEDPTYQADLKNVSDNSFVENAIELPPAVTAAPAAGGKRKSRKIKRKVRKITKRKINKRRKTRRH